MTSDIKSEIVNYISESAEYWIPSHQVEKCSDEILTELHKISVDPSRIIPILVQLQSQRHHLDFYIRESFITPRQLPYTDVEIQDWEGEDRKAPRAIIRNNLYTDIPVEEINIVKSVQDNPSAIKHFAIQIAIHRWTSLVRYHKNLYRAVGKVTVKRGTYPHERGVSKRSAWYKIAADHLKRVGGKAVLKGAKRTALPREVALFVRSDFILSGQLIYLRLAWELIREGAIIGNRLEYQIKALKETMDASMDKVPAVYEGIQDPYHAFNNRKRIPVSQLAEAVIAFLKSDKGSRFLNEPGKYRDMQSHFQSWFLNLDIPSLSKYRRKAKKVRDKVATKDILEIEAVLRPSLFNTYSLHRYIDLESPYTWISPSLPSGRREPCGSRPPTPPDMRFRIRRFT